MVNLRAFLPQKIFLLQGSQKTFDEITKEAKKDFEIIHSLMVSRFTMETAKEVITFAVEGDGSERILFVYFSIFSPDAAQVLLKSLEEPDLNTTIVFVTPYPYIVPTTIRSRVMLLDSNEKIDVPKKITKEAANLFVKNELSSESDEDASKRRSKAVEFLDNLETMFRDNPRKARTIYEAKHMLYRANIPTKYVVEYAITAVL